MKRFVLGAAAFAAIALTVDMPAKCRLYPAANSKLSSANIAKANVADGAKPAAAALTAYYYTPMGMTYAGTDRYGRAGAELAFAPVSMWLQTSAETTSGATVEWTFATAVDADGNETLRTSTQTDLQFRLTNAGLASAPVLRVQKDGLTAEYTTAAAGIEYGKLGTEDNFAVNYVPGDTRRFVSVAEVLTLNDDAATANLNMAMAGSGFTDFKVWGFAESFYYGKDFWIRKIGTEVESATPLTARDIAVTVFERQKTSVTTQQIGDFAVSSITDCGGGYYYVVFEPAQPILVTTALQVVVTAVEGSDAQFAPVVPLQGSYHASNAGTASLYADFKMYGKQATKQYFDFYGTGLEDEVSDGYLNHWNIGILGTYTDPTGVGSVVAGTGTGPDRRVYNLHGVCVSADGDTSRLPRGLYVCGGKKVWVR